VLNEDALDDGPDGVFTILIDDSSHGLVEMCVVVVLTRFPCSIKDECDHIVDRCMGWILRPFPNVVERVGLGHG